MTLIRKKGKYYMFNYDTAILELKQRLLLLENSKPVSTQSELAAVRCPICGDSDNIRSAHFYIGVKEYNGKNYIVYDCKKCGRHGFVTPALLHKLNIVDIFIETYIKSTMKDRRINTFGEVEDSSNTKVLFPKITKMDSKKIDYLSDRLQLDFSSNEMIQKYKIILNFESFLKINNIKNPAVRRDKIPAISEYGIGFLSEDKKSVSIRNMDPGGSYQNRFNIIHLFEGMRRPFMYIPPCNVDILTPYPSIAISESSFNIICCKNYFYLEDDSSVIFASASRKSYTKPILRLIQLSGFVHGQIDIFADNDDEDEDEEFNIEWYRNHLSKFIDNYDITIYFNMDENDFGNMPRPGEKFNYKTIRL
jgi:predicted nucleic-acid-binding Zn-ribbon protein